MIWVKKTAYIFCLCMLSVLVFYEVEHINKESTPSTGNETSSDRYVPTARFASQVQEENGINKNNEEEKKIAYLTFDDGPSKNTETVLKTLKEKNAVATFFLVGSEITPERETIVKETIAQGNAVGVHTYCHEKNKMYCNAECFLQDFDQASQVIERVTGEKPKLHRFPWGSNNGYVSSYVDELYEKLHKMGVHSYDWNVSGEDSVGGTVAQSTIFQNVKKDLTKYRQPIILLHDSASTGNTAAVLGKIIDYIKEEGYTFDTLDNREEYIFPASWR